MTEKQKRILSIFLLSVAIVAALVCWFYTFYFGFFAFGPVFGVLAVICAVLTVVFGALNFIFQKRPLRIVLFVLLAIALVAFVTVMILLLTGWLRFPG